MMETNQQLDTDLLFKAFYQYLLDAIISKNEFENHKNSQDSLKAKLPNSIAEVENLQVSIGKSLEDYKSNTVSGLFEETEKEIKNFIGVSLEKFKRKLSDDFKTKIAELEGSVSAAKTNSIKNIQAFLSMDFLKIVDSNIYVKWINGVYDAAVRYTAESAIEYDFSLNSRSSDLFKESLRFGFLEKGVRIPINSVSNWAGKDAQVDYEKIDKFYMASSSINKGNLFVEFADPDSNAKVTFVMSRGKENSFLSIEYKDDNHTVDVTGIPALNNMLEIDKIQVPLDRIYGTLKEIESNKTKLVRLVVDGIDILSSGSFRTLAVKIVEIEKEPLKNYIRQMFQSENKEKITIENLKQKLKLAGEFGRQVADILEVNPL
ncbi:MAG: hypothetical protein M1498_05165 [Candidatus Thermoplasmatota archaeon]|nr:hypothetical protein [Candidatus Thermoplasmatota archaeon]MCL5888795.1 hypothetical protein [Candidatus Thermoplasmatota archaeon]